MYKVPFLDLRVLDPEKTALLDAMERVLDHGRIVMGPELLLLEERIANYCNRKYAVGVNSGSDALMLALRAVGIEAGDEVITTSLSWVATANAIAMVGAEPVFADIEDDLNISPASIERLIGEKTKAIIVVHYTGLICQMSKIRALAEKHNIPLIEDAAQSFGATQDGRRAGSFGNVACFSMNPTKVLSALGESGVVLTDEEEVFQRLICLRYNGTVNKETCIANSLNYRMDTLQAAFLLERLEGLEALVTKRRKHAAFYDENLASIPQVSLPLRQSDDEHVYYTYTIRSVERDWLAEQLGGLGVETKVQHRCLMPHQPAFKRYRRDGLLNANRLAEEILCIPVHEKMTIEQLRYVVEAIKQCCQNLPLPENRL